MQRILVIRIDFLGDMICTTPFLHALKQRWPTAEIHVLANKYNRAVLDRNPDVTAVHTYVYSKQYERNVRPGVFNALRERLALICRLRRLRFDLLVVPNGGINKNGIQFAKQLNVADCRWHTAETGFDDYNPLHIMNRPMIHEALSGFTLVPELGKVNTTDSLQLRVYPDPALQAKWSDILGVKTKPRIGLFISNKVAKRHWSWQKWHQLATRLSAEADLLIFHDPVDKPTEQQLAELPVRCLSTPTVQDLIAAMTQLDLTISADSAPVHLSSALGIPVVVLFEARPEKYFRWYPIGVPNVLLYAGPQIEDISVESVLAAVTSLTAKKSDLM